MLKKLYKNEIRLYLSNIGLTVASVLMSVVLLGVQGYYTFLSLLYGGSIRETINLYQQNCVGWFILFVFVSFVTFFADQKCSMRECILIVKKAKARIILAKVLWLLTMLIAVSVMQFMMLYFGYFHFTEWKIEVAKHLVKLVLINSVLLGLVGIAIGAACSNCKQLIFGQILCVGAIAVFCFGGNLLASRLNAYDHEWIYKITDFLYLPPINNTAYNPLFGASTEKQRIFAMLFLIILFAFVTWYPVIQNVEKKKRLLLQCGVFLTLSAILFVYAGFPLAFQFNRTLQSEAFYIKTAVTRPKNEQAYFKISAYDMEFDLRNHIEGKVTVHIESGQDLEEYKFTLLEAMKVKTVSDQNGNRLPFVREGNYVAVHNVDKQEIYELTFVYSGASELAQANERGVQLATLQCFYPIAGYHTIMTTANTNFNIINHESEVDFNIKIKSPLKIYSNLENNGNVWSGRAKQIYLLAGFVWEKQCGDITYLAGLERGTSVMGVIPDWLGNVEEELVAIYDYLNTPLEKRVTTKGKTILTGNVYTLGTANTFEGDAVCFDDFVFLSTHATTLCADKALSAACTLATSTLKVNGDRAYVMEWLYYGYFRNIYDTNTDVDAWLSTYDNVDELISVERSYYRKTSHKYAWYLSDMAQKQGLYETVVEVYNFLSDEDDMRTAAEFFADHGYEDAIEWGRDFIKYDNINMAVTCGEIDPEEAGDYWTWLD